MSEEVELTINTTPREKNISELSDTEKDFRRTIFWKSCCFELDRRAVKFFSQLTISLIVIIFSLYQLYRDKNTDIYLSLLTMIMGVYVEAPRLH
jgi:hypothetical protein